MRDGSMVSSNARREKALRRRGQWKRGEKREREHEVAGLQVIRRSGQVEIQIDVVGLVRDEGAGKGGHAMGMSLAAKVCSPNQQLDVPSSNAVGSPGDLDEKIGSPEL